jgi:hypothetical protein
MGTATVNPPPILANIDLLSKLGVGGGIAALFGSLMNAIGNSGHIVIAQGSGITTAEIITFLGAAVGVITVVINAGIGWYHLLEKSRRDEYMAWRLARESTIDDLPALETLPGRKSDSAVKRAETGNGQVQAE